ncbi:hypothetical protein ATY81_02650 [Rhizobium sp. R72]|nr:hypothetical protein ATY81_02650 [Rhizobium sp. R72]OWW05943.1 hypothetical protein ATY80_02650 [Rhizobium sp. R711]
MMSYSISISDVDVDLYINSPTPQQELMFEMISKWKTMPLSTSAYGDLRTSSVIPSEFQSAILASNLAIELS